MFISSHNVETALGLETAACLCEWLRLNAPVCCKRGDDHGGDFQFDIDDALEFCKIRMLYDDKKKEFFPYLARLKSCQVSGMFGHARSA